MNINVFQAKLELNQKIVLPDTLRGVQSMKGLSNITLERAKKMKPGECRCTRFGVKYCYTERGVRFVGKC